jgi:multiple antibiotic resistance protein
LLSGKFAESRTVNSEVQQEALQKADISFSPMAMPLLAGPGSISMLIAKHDEYQEWEDRLVVSGVIAALGLVCFLILRAAPLLAKLFGVAGLNAVSRIMGFLSMSIGVQTIIVGVYSLIRWARVQH